MTSCSRAPRVWVMMSLRRVFREEDCISVMATPLAKRVKGEQQQLGFERALFHSTTPFGKNDNVRPGRGLTVLLYWIC